ILDVVIDDEVEFPFGENVLFGPGSTQISIFHGQPLLSPRKISKRCISFAISCEQPEINNMSKLRSIIN
ncbi:MAG: hypothetical protein KAV87_09105, partial [Desulfobacteraceae bacterium]|nr:hypothetical protein [Desulfobacteraceae bacterium]